METIIIDLTEDQCKALEPINKAFDKTDGDTFILAQVWLTKSGEHYLSTALLDPEIANRVMEIVKPRHNHQINSDRATKPLDCAGIPFDSEKGKINIR